MNYSGKAEKIASIVRCPACYGTVALEEPRIHCNSCGALYHFDHSCPVLMTQEDKEHLSNFLAIHASQTVPAINSAIRRFFFPPGPCHDPRRPKRIKKLWDRFGPEKVIIDVGAQNKSLREDIITFDLAPFSGVNLAGNALRMPIASGSVDLVINTGVLEHVEDVEKVVSEFHRILRPGGVVYTEIPFMQGYHPDPTDFQRLTYQGLQRTFRAFDIEDMEISSGPFSNVAWTIREACASFFEHEAAFTWTWMAAGWLTFWIKYLDTFIVANKFAHRIASSYYVIAAKRQ